jgi:DNA-directed RNA polymerase specialized sigma24 family protein
MPHPEDRDLVARVLAADEAAFHRLYERYFPRVLAFAARRLAPGGAVRAATEAIFMELFEALSTYRADVPLDAFVFGIVRRRLDSASAPAPRAAAPPARLSEVVPRLARAVV